MSVRHIIQAELVPASRCRRLVQFERLLDCIAAITLLAVCWQWMNSSFTSVGGQIKVLLLFQIMRRPLSFIISKMTVRKLLRLTNDIDSTYDEWNDQCRYGSDTNPSGTATRCNRICGCFDYFWHYVPYLCHSPDRVRYVCEHDESGRLRQSEFESFLLSIVFVNQRVTQLAWLVSLVWLNCVYWPCVSSKSCVSGKQNLPSALQWYLFYELLSSYLVLLAMLSSLTWICVVTVVMHHRRLHVARAYLGRNEARLMALEYEHRLHRIHMLRLLLRAREIEQSRRLQQQSSLVASYADSLAQSGSVVSDITSNTDSSANNSSESAVEVAVENPGPMPMQADQRESDESRIVSLLSPVLENDHNLERVRRDLDDVEGLSEGRNSGLRIDESLSPEQQQIQRQNVAAHFVVGSQTSATTLIRRDQELTDAIHNQRSIVDRLRRRRDRQNEVPLLTALMQTWEIVSSGRSIISEALTASDDDSEEDDNPRERRRRQRRRLGSVTGQFRRRLARYPAPSQVIASLPTHRYIHPDRAAEEKKCGMNGDTSMINNDEQSEHTSNVVTLSQARRYLSGLLLSNSRRRSSQMNSGVVRGRSDETGLTEPLKQHHESGDVELSVSNSDSHSHESESDDSKQPSCGICIVPFEHGDEIKTLPCDHEFHSDCVDQWLHIKRTCPFCRYDVTGLTSNTSSLPSPMIPIRSQSDLQSSMVDSEDNPSRPLSEAHWRSPIDDLPLTRGILLTTQPQGSDSQLVRSYRDTAIPDPSQDRTSAMAVGTSVEHRAPVIMSSMNPNSPSLVIRYSPNNQL